MHVFLRFNSGVMRMSAPARLWLLLLVTANMVVPLFFLGQLEAQVVLATFVASVALMLALTANSGLFLASAVVTQIRPVLRVS